jgi:phage head maturation protease
MSVTVSGPRGWNPATISHRFADTKPSSFDAATRTVDCVISMGSPVVRFYGTEVLRIAPGAVGLDRMKDGSIIPLLDSHQGVGINNALGRFQKTWFQRGGLMGQIRFNETPNGTMAMGMVERGEIAGISAGYTVKEWEISDAKGNILDPEVANVRWDDNLTFTAVKWDLHEGSLVSVPADSLSGIRSLGSTGLDRAFAGIRHDGVTDIVARMNSRERMMIRARMVAAQSVIGGYRE